MQTDEKPRLTLADIEDRDTVSVDEAAEVLGVSRMRAYASVKDGTIPAIRFGRRLVVPVAGLRRLLGVGS